MATRHNACVNPALKIDAAGWGGDMVPARVDVSGAGEGFARQWAARYGTSGSFVRTPAGLVTAGLAYTLSAYVYRPGTVYSSQMYIGWVDGNGTEFGYPSAVLSLPGASLTRVSITATAPAGAVKANMILTVTTVDVSQILIEQAALLDTYFDGDTGPPLSSWDGADGASASTLSDAAAPTLGTLAGHIRVTSAASGRPRTAAALSGAAATTSTMEGA